jgi:hypothetical protein
MERRGRHEVWQAPFARQWLGGSDGAITDISELTKSRPSNPVSRTPILSRGDSSVSLLSHAGLQSDDHSVIRIPFRKMLTGVGHASMMCVRRLRSSAVSYSSALTSWTDCLAPLLHFHKWALEEPQLRVHFIEMTTAAGFVLEPSDPEQPNSR